MNEKISRSSSLLLVLASVCLTVSLYVPIWQIDLDAPQYPEGLKLEIWAHKIAGDVEIINGLNHYIGMKTLHSDDFPEFTILPYLIGTFVLAFLLVAIIRSKKTLIAALAAFILFGIVAMADFWYWEYDYGHTLDPSAAIKVPGMTYQPPLIGFKQLLNFGAFSVPDTGGWLFIAAGLLVVGALLNETILRKRRLRYATKNVKLPAILLAIMLFSCGSDGPQALKLNIDGCDFCRMTISDGKFGAEITTKKGRAYTFDDLSCMIAYLHENDAAGIKNFYVCDFPENNRLTDATKAWYVTHKNIRSPMGGNTAAFSSRQAAEAFAAENGVTVGDWKRVSEGEHHHQNDHGHHH